MEAAVFFMLFSGSLESFCFSCLLWRRYPSWIVLVTWYRYNACNTLMLFTLVGAKFVRFLSLGPFGGIQFGILAWNICYKIKYQLTKTACVYDWVYREVRIATLSPGTKRTITFSLSVHADLRFFAHDWWHLIRRLWPSRQFRQIYTSPILIALQ